MARASKIHLELGENGEGLCSVPMWMGGCPAGFCDRPAFGSQRKETWFEEMTGQRLPYCPGLACSIHGGPTQTQKESEEK